MANSSPRVAAAAVRLALLALLLAPGALAAEPAEGSDDAARMLARLAETAQDERITRGWLALGSGVALTGAGLLDEADGDAGFGRVVWIAGLLSLTGGVLSFVLPTPLERLERDAGSRSADYSPRALQERWRSQAEKTYAARKIISIVQWVISGTSLAASGALVAGLGDWSERRRERWAVQLFAVGTLFTSAGITTLLIRSDTEKGYDLAYAPRAGAGLQLHFAPVRAGATLQLGGTF